VNPARMARMNTRAPVIFTSIFLVFAISFFGSPTPAHAATTSQTQAATYQVTVAARACPNYSDVFANRSRNNIMESLQNLGPDSPYTSFTQVLPLVEDGYAPQTSCHALSGWKFSFGSGYTRPVPGTNLSYVTGTSSTNNRIETTKSSTPLLDQYGVPTGTNIAGATTFTLSQSEISMASAPNRYWVMGGTPSQPLGPNPADYGFAALRCATDNLNGDNVEWISFPTTATHVFCYAFYVQPPPTAGVINIVKKITAPQPSDQTFNFNGSLSYAPAGALSLTVPAGSTTTSQSFVRGAVSPGGSPWTLAETVPSAYQLTGMDCTSSLGTSTWSTFGSDQNSLLPGGANGLAITLAAGDTVTCTYENSFIPPLPGYIELVKQVRTADGSPIPSGVLPQSFNYNLSGPGGASSTTSLTVNAGTSDSGPPFHTSLVAGTWTVSEDTPSPSPGWRWQVEGAECALTDGSVVSSATASVTIDVPAGGGAACAFTNEMVPLGSLTIRFTSFGGTGTFSADISSGSTALSQIATTLSSGQAVVATGDSTSPLMGSWTVIPSAPAPTAAGRFELISSPSCNVTEPHAANIGTEQLMVAPSNPVVPDIVCDYQYRFVPSSTIDIEKIITGPTSARTGPVVLTVNCDDGASASLTIEANESTPARLAAPLVIPSPTVCHVAEQSTGLSPGASVATATAVTRNSAAAGADIANIRVGVDSDTEAVLAVVHDAYTLPTPPPPTPKPGPPVKPVSPGTTTPTQPLAYTGTDLTTELAVAATLVSLGLFLVLLAAKLRRRR